MALNKVMNPSRIPWIDGLKGIASLLIVLHHFVLAFVPALYYGDVVEARLFSNEGNLADSPLLFFIGGHFLVNLFLMLSGFVLSLQTYRTPSIRKLLHNIADRYFRLSFRLFIVSFIVYIFLKYDLFAHKQIVELTGSPWLSLYYQSPLSLKEVFKSSFYTVWFVGDDSFSTAFWMLVHLFMGSLLTYIIIYTIKKSSITNQLILILVIIFTSIYYDSYLVNFGYGMLIAWNYKHQIIHTNKIWISLLLLFIGILLSGYPQGVIPTNAYSVLSFLSIRFKTSIFLHSFGAFLIIFTLISSSFKLNTLTSAIPQFLGKISFSIYLLHIPVLFSFSSYLFDRLNRLDLDYGMNVVITFMMTFAAVIASASIFEKFIVWLLHTSHK